MTVRNDAPPLPRVPSTMPRRLRARCRVACAPFLNRPASLAGRVALLAANVAAITFFLLSYSRRGVSFGPYRIDLDVYRIGGQAWLHGENLYGRLPATRAGARLPFTYPPVAAALLAPFSTVPMAVAATVLTLATIALLTVVLRVFLRRLAGPAAGSWWAIAWLLPAALFVEPVRDTLGFGQVNVVLMALVSLDCLAETPRWPRGALTGLAAAVKLTPAAFALFFLARRDGPAAGTAAFSFLATTALGYAISWHDSVRYWTGAAFQVSRAGGTGAATNQSILAVLARAGLDPHAPAAFEAWLALSAAAVVVAWGGMSRALPAAEDCLALSLNAFAALLISPVSWSHHWVWCVPALLTFTATGVRRRSRRLLIAGLTGLAIFAASPQFWFQPARNAGVHPASWQQFDASPYALFATVVLVLSCAGTVRRTSQAREISGQGATV